MLWIHQVLNNSCAFKITDASSFKSSVPNIVPAKITVVQDEANHNEQTLNDANVTYILDISAIVKMSTSLGERQLPGMSATDMVPMEFGSESNSQYMLNLPESNDQDRLPKKPGIIAEEIVCFPLLPYLQSENLDSELYSLNKSCGNTLTNVSFDNYGNQQNSMNHNELLEIGQCSTSTIVSSSLCRSDTEKTTNSEEKEEYVPTEDDSKTSHENATLGLNAPGIWCPEDMNLRVPVSATPPHQKRNFCVYCKKFQAKIARHLETVHSEEEEVKKFASLPVKSDERKKIIATIRKEGNYLFNNDQRFNTGELLLCRRPNERMRKTAQDFIACGNCKGLYAKSVIRHHWRKCTGNVAKKERNKSASGPKVVPKQQQQQQENASESSVLLLKDEQVPMEEEVPSYGCSPEPELVNDDAKPSHETSVNSHDSNLAVSAPQEPVIRVPVSATPAYQKKNFCFYCKKFEAKIARHLETVHSAEEDVKKFASLPPKSDERKRIIALIRKRGNHLYNNDQRFNTGELLVCRRPNIRMHKTAQDFIACAHCKGHYAKSVIRHHWRKCTGRDDKFQLSSVPEVTAEPEIPASVQAPAAQLSVIEVTMREKSSELGVTSLKNENSSMEDDPPNYGFSPEIESATDDDHKSLSVSLGLNKPGISAPDDANLRVPVSAMPAHQKKNFCFYCQKFEAKIARHLETLHSEEEDVKKFASLPVKSDERKRIIAIIRKRGNHLFNNDQRFNTGELLVCRRPNQRMHKTAQDFIACGNCKGHYAKSVIRHHWRKCTGRDAKNERIIAVSGRKVTARLHERASDLVRKYIFPYLREDNIVRGIRYDELIIMYANKQCEKYGTHQHHYQMIRARLRLLGRFFEAIKKINSAIVNFADVFTPHHYDSTVSAVKLVAGYNEQSRAFAHPAVESSLGSLLKQCGDLLRLECIERHCDWEQKQVEDFLKLHVEDNGSGVNRAASDHQAQRNRRKKVVLPSTEDVRKLETYLRDERLKCFEELLQGYTYDAWKKLAEYTLVALQLFNVRRPGEVERIYLEDFKKYQGIENVTDKDTYNALSEEGKNIARKYIRFEIRGKFGRGVPVLVHKELCDCLELIVHYRNDAGVPRCNPYLFGLPGSDDDRCKYLRACRLMHECAQRCEAAIPSTLRGIKLRKHIAAQCINFNLSDGQVADLAHFMGHEDEIHQEIYRQPILQTDIDHLTKILKHAQGYKESTSESEDSEDDASNLPGEYTGENGMPQSATEPTLDESTADTNTRGWTDAQRNAVLTRFKSTFESNEMPTGKEIRDFMNEEPCLQNKTLPQIRTWLYAQKKKNAERMNAENSGKS